MSVEPNHPLTITLAAASWNLVLSLVAQGPWERVDGLMRELQKQLAEQTNDQTGAPT